LCQDRAHVFSGQAISRAASNLVGRRRSQAPLDLSHQRAETLGIVINGLAISDVEANLEAYYRNHLIVGPSAFVIQISSFRDFSTAITKKLIREIDNT